MSTDLMDMAKTEVEVWVEIALATLRLALESAGVVGLRAARASIGGPDAATEAWRMCSEKVTALAELQADFLSGSLGITPASAAKGSVNHYRRKVAANRRRLNRTAQITDDDR